MKVVMAGDWHRDGKWARETLRAAALAGAGALVHVGDLGAFRDTEALPELGPHGFTGELAAAVAEAGIPFYFVDGNHEDHPALARLPRRADGLAEQDGIVYLPRGSRLELGGRTFGALGGAFSVDRAWGTEGVDWFPEEEIGLRDVDRLGRDPLDVLVAHEVPFRVPMSSPFTLPPAVVAQGACSRLLLQLAVDTTEPSLVFSGHWHQRTTVPVPGTGSTVHVLDRERTPGNAVLLDTDTLAVEPLPVGDAAEAVAL